MMKKMNIKFFNKTILIYLLLTASVWSGEITSFSEKKFFQLFPTKVCDQIYEKLNYGEDELEGDVLVEVNQDINALTVDEYKNIFSINFSTSLNFERAEQRNLLLGYFEHFSTKNIMV